MNDTIRETLRLVFSSTRSMPARFMSNGDRTQSFCIDFEPLDEKADLAMASESWGSVGNFLDVQNRGTEVLSDSQMNLVIRCGEDIMVGAFILTKLNGVTLMKEMRMAVIDDTIKAFGEKIENLASILGGEQVVKYLDHCANYGQMQTLA